MPFWEEIYESLFTAAICVIIEKSYLHLLSISLSRLHYQDCVAQVLFPSTMLYKSLDD